MIKLVVGLGNPGRQYEKTRHNAGFLFLDGLASECGCVFASLGRFEGMFAECRVGTEKLMLLKPETFMNRSGRSVGKIARYYKLLPENILVVHDELDFNVGVVKLKKGGGHAGHNGLRDIIEHLGTSDFYRLRIGIGRPAGEKPVVEYVLSTPPKNEWERLLAACHLGSGFIAHMVCGDMATVMSRLNAANLEKN